MAEIEIYTDGACRGNGSTLNLGAYGYVLRFNDVEKSFSKAVLNTTNNQMELTAMIEALKQLKPSAKNYNINVYSDSQYVIKGITEWSDKWVRSGFKGVKNTDLWRELLSLVSQYTNIHFNWVKGHSNNVGNALVDKMCNEAMDKVAGEINSN